MENASRRRFLTVAGATAAALAGITSVHAEPQSEQAQWLATHQDTRVMGADGAPSGWVPRWTHLRLLRGLPNGWVEVWVPRLALVGRVPFAAVGPVTTPSSADVEAERAQAGPPVRRDIGLPARVVRSGNLRLWPATRPAGAAASTSDTLLRTLPHNAPLRVISSVEGEEGDEWYQVQLLKDGGTADPAALGYIHSSVVRLPRVRYSHLSPDRADTSGRWFEADLLEPAILVAYENGQPLWSTLALKGTAANKTPTGSHRILYQVANETMSSETLHPPIPRDAPGGYFLKNVLYTQYFTWDGASIHYNYWSSNWGYPGSHGCLGIALSEAKFAWEFGNVGMPVRIFA